MLFEVVEWLKVVLEKLTLTCAYQPFSSHISYSYINELYLLCYVLLSLLVSLSNTPFCPDHTVAPWCWHKRYTKMY